jgi:hypothetical protein
MTRVFELYPQAVSQKYILAVMIWLKVCQGFFCVCHSVQWQGRPVFGKPPFIGPIGVFFLEMARVAQKDVTQVAGGMGAMYLSLETLITQPGKIT